MYFHRNTIAKTPKVVANTLFISVSFFISITQPNDKNGHNICKYFLNKQRLNQTFEKSCVERKEYSFIKHC